MTIPIKTEQQLETQALLRAYLLIGDEQGLLKQTGELLAPGWVFDVEDEWTNNGVLEGIQKKIPAIAVYCNRLIKSNSDCIWKCLEQLDKSKYSLQILVWSDRESTKILLAGTEAEPQSNL